MNKLEKEKNYFLEFHTKKVCSKMDQQQNGLHQSVYAIKSCTLSFLLCFMLFWVSDKFVA